MVDDLNEKPSQLKFIRPAEMLLFAKAICDPPLGQATTIPSGQQTVCPILELQIEPKAEHAIDQIQRSCRIEQITTRPAMGGSALAQCS